MQLVEAANEDVIIRASRAEIYIIQSALNEVCNGIEIFEFQTRMGATRAEVVDLLRSVLKLAHEMKS